MIDAADTLAKFMGDGLPDCASVQGVCAGECIAQLAADGRHVHAFGEMVALLWAEGKRHAAIRLEELWNELGKSHRFALFCAYPMASFDDRSHTVPFNGFVPAILA